MQFFTHVFAVLLPDLSRQYCHSVQRIFLKMNTRHHTRKPVKKCNYWGRFSKRNGEEGRTASACKIFGDRFYHRRDMAIFRLFKMAVATIMDFKISEIFNGQTAQEGRAECAAVPNLVEIRRKAAEI